MPTEKQKMVAGQLYDASDPELVADRLAARRLLKKLNDSGPDDAALRREVTRQLLGRAGEGVWLEPPFYCDYGYNISLGDRAYFNFGATILDVAPVKVGAGFMAGPHVQLLTATHPVAWQDRLKGPELARPITIGEGVWLGGGVIVCPGVTIGDHAVVGAGSVVTRDIPPEVVAAGNPCKVLRPL